MFITVKHLPKEYKRDMSCIYDDKEIESFIKEVIKNNDMIRVADIVSSNNITDIDYILEQAFRLTNSIESSWYLNKDIDVADIAKDGCRSTSKGDIIMVDGETYIVTTYGFTKL